MEFKEFKTLFTCIYVAGGSNPNECLKRLDNSHALCKMIWQSMQRDMELDQMDASFNFKQSDIDLFTKLYSEDL